MIYITGDTHGGMDVKKLNTKNFPDSKNMSKSDYLIITGDFGFVWDNSKQDQYWLKWLNNKNFTTLFVDGNHENFDLLYSYPIDYWNGGKAHLINDSVIHLMRGQVYSLYGIKLFTFGGAKSGDIEYRKEYITWWKQEEPSDDEFQEGIENLEKNNWQVDYVISHTCSTRVLNRVNKLFNKDKVPVRINDYLDDVDKKLKYRHWYFGHFHSDGIVDEKNTVVYQNIIKV